MNGLYNTLSASIKNTNTNLSNYQSYDALLNTTLSNTVYSNYNLQNAYNIYYTNAINTISNTICSYNTRCALESS